MASGENKGCKGCLIALVIFFGIIILLGALFVGGIIYIFKHTDEIDVEWDESDVESFYEKTGTENDEDTPGIIDLINGDFEIFGQVEVDETFTDEEITGILNEVAKEDGLIEDVKFRAIGEDEFETSFVVTDAFMELEEVEDIFNNLPQVSKRALGMAANTPLYLSGTFEYNDNKLDATITKIKLGYIEIPVDKIEDPIAAAIDGINNLISGNEEIAVESIKLSDDGVEYVGSMPEEIDKK